ncbi:MAG: tetratricopeptide repeat protein [Polyangiales bacterium]
MRPQSLCRATRRSLAALTMLAALSSSSIASAQRGNPINGPNPAVEALLRRADAAQEATDYATALTLYQQAYTEGHDAIVLFNIGRMHVQLRHWSEGRRALQNFLDQVPNAPSRPLCERMIREADEEIARERAAQNTGNGQGNGQASGGQNREPQLIEVEGPAPRWPWALTGVGGALVLGSIVTGALYAVNDSGLRARGCYAPMPGTLDCPPSERQAVSDVQLLGGLTLGFSAGGAVLAGLGTTLAFVLPRPRILVARPVSVRALPGGAMVVVGGSF